MKSLSEIETTVKRATKASGYSWGVAEETAKCVRLFEHLRVTHVMAARDVKGATRVELTHGSVIGQIL